MPLQATCPDCGTTYRVADATRGKKIRCSRCKTVFTAAAADEGKDGYAITPAPPQAAAPRVPRKPIVRHDFEDEEEPSFKKKSSSMLPYLLVGVGLLVLLCAGLPIAGYVVWLAAAEDRALAEAAARQRVAAEREMAARGRLDEDPLGEQARQRAEEAFAKAQADHERFREEMRKRMGEDMQEADRLQKEAQKRIEEDIEATRKLIQKEIENIGAGNLPMDPFNPFAPQAPREMVQVVSRSIPLGVRPHAVLSILWTAADSKQAVVVRMADQGIGLDQYDLTTGRKLGSLETPIALVLSSIRDVSPDGKHYLCNISRTSYSIWNLPNPRPIVEKWQPPAILHKGVPPARHDVVAAYLLSGSRLLTVNDAGQAALWSLPKAGKGKPTPERTYTPEATVARYPAPLVDRGIALSPDRTRLAIFNGSDGFLVLDTATLQLQGVVTSPEDALPATDPMRGIHGVAFSPDGQQLAASILSQSIRPGATPKEKQLIRWDLKTRQRTARFAERSMKSGGPGSRIAWWGNDHIWVASTLLPGSLISWDKQRVVLDSALGFEEKVCFGNTDGKCWFLVVGPDGKSVLKSVDLPADALQKADKPLELTKDGIARK